MYLKKNLAAELIFLWCFFSSIIIASIYSLLDIEVNLLFLKDFFLLAFLLILFKASIRIPYFSFTFIILLIYLFICSFVSDAPLMAKAASIRQMVIPFELLFIGVFLGNGVNINKIKTFIINTGLIVLVLGLIEIGYSIWHYIDITDYFLIKNLPVFGKNYVDFYNYPVFFIEPSFGGVKRMTSTLLDPINLGHSFAIILSYVLFDKTLGYKAKKKYLLSLIFFLGILLTFSKGAFLQFIIVFILITDKITRNIKLIIVVVFAFALVYLSEFHSGVKLHLMGLETSLNKMKLFGYGVGRAGNQADLFGDQEITYGDTFFGSIIGQVGLLGYILWITPFIIILKKLKLNLTSKILISQLLISLISENAFNFLSIFIICIIAGIEYKKSLLNG